MVLGLQESEGGGMRQQELAGQPPYFSFFCLCSRNNARQLVSIFVFSFCFQFEGFLILPTLFLVLKTL